MPKALNETSITPMTDPAMPSRPRLVIAASSQSFDPVALSYWEDEGFDVRFEPVRDASRSSIRSIESIGDSLEGGEKFAVVSLFSTYIFLLDHETIQP